MARMIAVNIGQLFAFVMALDVSSEMSGRRKKYNLAAELAAIMT